MNAEEQTRRRDLFLEDISRAFDVGLQIAERHAAEGKDAVSASREALFACLHNVMVTFDHGTQLADHFNVFVVDEDGNELTEGALHEDLVQHLDVTGRYS